VAQYVDEATRCRLQELLSSGEVEVEFKDYNWKLNSLL
jgi:hypothetical protein